MTAHAISVDILLGFVALTCWLGVIGMLRMEEPMQALHYLTLPATVGIIALTIAVFVETGIGATSFKTLLIALVLLGINSVVTHATARAFRTRELGHWEPRDGDPMQPAPQEPAS
ncbi:MAG TPA: monovalent cation/H(+) antiporter subunit G [Acidisarcina sp.]